MYTRGIVHFVSHPLTTLVRGESARDHSPSCCSGSMPATSRWTAKYYASDADESSSDGDDEHVVDAPSPEDEISTTARRVLADLEKFFDPELCESEEDDADGSGSNQWSAISLDELSVVLNASIQRHQPPAARVDRAVQANNHEGADDQSPARLDAKAVGLDAKAKSRPARSLSHQRLPFADFLDLRKQKAELFRERRRESRRGSSHQVRKSVQLQERGRREYESQSSSGSGSAVRSEKPEDPDADNESEDCDPGDDNNALLELVSSPARSRGSSAMSDARTNSRRLSVSPPATRDAVTQATLMQDQSQQTDVPKHQARKRQVIDAPASKGNRRGSRGSFAGSESSGRFEEERKAPLRDDPPSRSTASSLRPKPLSLSLQPSESLAEPPSPPSLSSGIVSSPSSSSSSAASAKKSCGSNNFGDQAFRRVAQIHCFTSNKQQDQHAPTQTSSQEVRSRTRVKRQRAMSSFSSNDLLSHLDACTLDRSRGRQHHSKHLKLRFPTKLPVLAS